jgi:hypothetical protein
VRLRWATLRHNSIAPKTPRRLPVNA